MANSRSTLTTPILSEDGSMRTSLSMSAATPSASPSPEERFQQSYAEIKNYIQAHGWDAAAMFFGTLAYMGIYYLEDYFAVFGETGGYVIHNLAMGVGANAAALPFVWKGRRCEGQETSEANQNSGRYFLLCSAPDSLYQPVQDWLIAMTKSGSPIRFDFEKNANEIFSPVEIAASFSLFGVGFGLLYYVMKKMLIKHDHVEEIEEKFEDRWQQFYKKSRDFLQTAEWESAKSALQYFIFYLSDYLFDLSLSGSTKTMLNLLGCSAWMGGYSFIFDSLPELLGYLQISRERKLHLLAESALLSESLDADYVHISVGKNSIQSETDAIVEEIVEAKNQSATDAADMATASSQNSTPSAEVARFSVATTASLKVVDDTASSLGTSGEFSESLEADDGELVASEEIQEQQPLLSQNLVSASLMNGAAKLTQQFGVFKSIVSQVVLNGSESILATIPKPP